MAKKVSEANKGIQALAKKAPEVVKKMGYVMQMGKHSGVSPTNFKTKDAMMMSKSPMYNLGEYVDFTSTLSSNEESTSKPSGSDLIKQGKELKKQGRQQNRQEKKSNRKEKRVERLEERKELQEFKGKKKLDEGNKVGAYYKQQRINRINKRIAKNK